MRVIVFFTLFLCSAAMTCADEPNAVPSWDWQLQGPYDYSVDVDWIDLEPDEQKADQISQLRGRGLQTICYVSVGTVETYRRDEQQFPEQVLGRIYEEWPDEQFLDIRQKELLLPLMAKRFRRCKELGFDAVEPDNQDLHTNETGFPIRAEDTVSYLHDLARLAHSMGLKIGQKNVPELTGALLPVMDFVITESCFSDKWCEDVLPYVQAGKPVFAAEYKPETFPQACDWGKQHGVAFILKKTDLGAWRETCP